MEDSADNMSQRCNDNTKRPKLKKNLQGILKIWTEGLGARRKCYWGYVLIYENTNKKLLHLPLKVDATLSSSSKKSAVGA